MIFQKFSQIKVVVLDVDGVLTDGTLQVTESGDQLRTFYVKDGYAMQLAEKMGLNLWVISGGKSEGVRKRLQGLGIQEIHLGVSQKMDVLNDLLAKYNLTPDQLMYVGDDMPDYEVMQVVGIAACPVDSVEDIKAIAHYMSPFKGGHGVVRDVLEKILKIQGKWGIQTHIKSV
ncbi:HAD-IIIA family hydrolase [Sphingobacterium sp. DK4209]|uniref:HAD-IIIA family hydrolase n=1 Tax=Sphingobacterium zhuxiongii TaxID=2662364 RepID=A0A5Q0Q902_9SPHI|nr:MULTISPECIES: HAD-IIIA family hydrolase [unclassified Sphingobacterium]MVZ64993.1 HAD-IIIA family hydrolase [Sphingobacterium sp. DK4209]QGA25331.1 HAD-IIIA family hydrolase [Sphingobacterium sp. dk4302]